MNRKVCLAVAALLFSQVMVSGEVVGDIVLPKVFCDHMVLQRNSDVPIWGTSEPGQRLTLSFGESENSIVADDDGNWELLLTTSEAGGPYKIKISSADSDAKIQINNVMVGDVWLCGGQSNMELPVSEALNPEIEIEQSKQYLNLRLFSVEHHVASAPLGEFSKIDPWRVCSPESVKQFSAVAYYYGRELNQHLKDVPIGLVDSTWGGTPCEAWASLEKLSTMDSAKPLLDYWQQSDELNSNQRPGGLFNGMVAPLTRFPIRGVIWYQGETNVGRGAQYAQLFPALIADWRQHFGQPQLPFYFVQLAPFRHTTFSPVALPEVWDAQLNTARRVPGTGMAITTDLGDIADIHPKNKQEVGRRLALLAMGDVYRSELGSEALQLDTTGPIYESFSQQGNCIQIRFSQSESGLKIADVAGGAEELTCFTICGADQKFYPAKAVIVENMIEVCADEVSEPDAVRFAWEDTAAPNLVNGVGLPASPFRTDDFPLTSVGNEF